MKRVKTQRFRSRVFSYTTKALAIMAGLAIIASACGRSDDDGSSTATTDPSFCAEQTLEATEIGVSETKITILVMADVGFTLAPGLFQGSIDGVNAWADYINRNGGLACRQIEVIEHDSAIDAVKTTNGFLRACEDALALVGSTPLFALDTKELNKCPDKAGSPVGVPDIPERAVEAAHECSPNTFNISGGQGVCPHGGSGERTYFTNVGGFKRLLDESLPDAHGVFLIPADFASTIAALVPVARAAEAVGVGRDAEFGVSARQEQATFGQYLNAIKEHNANYAWSGSNDVAMLNWRREAEIQGGFEDIEWGCILSCYTPDFIADPVSEGTGVSLNFLPYSERDTNEDLDTFLTEIGSDFPPAWAAGAWGASRLFETVVNAVVDEFGVNGLTRQRLLDELNSITDYDGRGWFGVVDLSTGINSPCFISLRVIDGEYVRLHPEQRGTFDCSPDNLYEHTLDVWAEFGN